MSRYDAHVRARETIVRHVCARSMDWCLPSLGDRVLAPEDVRAVLPAFDWSGLGARGRYQDPDRYGQLKPLTARVPVGVIHAIMCKATQARAERR